MSNGNENLESKRWLIAIAAIVLQLCLGTVYAWSVFKNPLMTAHGWSQMQVQMTFMILIGMIGISAAFGGGRRGQEGSEIRRHHRRNPLRRRHDPGGRRGRDGQPLHHVRRLWTHRRPRQRLRLRYTHRHPDPLVPGQARSRDRARRHGLRFRRLLHRQDRPRHDRQNGRGQFLLYPGRDLPGPVHPFRPRLQESPEGLAPCRLHAVQDDDLGGRFLHLR